MAVSVKAPVTSARASDCGSRNRSCNLSPKDRMRQRRKMPATLDHPEPEDLTPSLPEPTATTRNTRESPTRADVAGCSNTRECNSRESLGRQGRGAGTPQTGAPSARKSPERRTQLERSCSTRPVRPRQTIQSDARSPETRPEPQERRRTRALSFLHENKPNLVKLMATGHRH